VKILITLLCFLAAFGFAQKISGTLYASDVKGFVVIGCLLDLTTQDCDYDKSPYFRVTQSGSSASYELETAVGDYLIIAWKDTNSNADVDNDGSDEVGLYVDSNNEPALVTSPASNIDIRMTASANNPLTSQPSSNPLSSQPAKPPTEQTAEAKNPTSADSPLGALVGIWQQTVAAGGDYKNLNTGYTFSMISGYSVLLKIRANGDYVMQFSSSGVTSNCALASSLESSVGTVTYQDNQLILQPEWHTLEQTDCDASTPDKVDLGTEPIVYTFELREEFDMEGLRILELILTGKGNPLDLTILHREPLMPGYQSAQPTDFVLGTDPPYQEIIGLWAQQQSSDVNFYNPQTGEFYLPEWNGAVHYFLRFQPDGTYELGKAWDNYADYDGICNKDYVYYERGVPTFSITESQEDGDVLGHTRFQATDARLIVNIRDCGNDDQVLRYSLVPQISYYQWEYWPSYNRFYLNCAWEKSEWQFMICDNFIGDSVGFDRRQ
jgi:hypothetical protein